MSELQTIDLNEMQAIEGGIGTIGADGQITSMLPTWDERSGQVQVMTSAGLR